MAIFFGKGAGSLSSTRHGLDLEGLLIYVVEKYRSRYGGYFAILLI